MTTKNTPNQPSWGSWLRDGAQLIGLDQAQQDKLKAQTLGAGRQGSRRHHPPGAGHQWF